MKYIAEFRDGALAKNILQAIHAEVDSSIQYKFMEFCGGHTHAIYRYGVPSLLPKNVHMIHGPGCPVCVLPIARVDKAIAFSNIKNTIFCSYADMMRVPGSYRMNLLKAKSQGADVRMVYSIDDALNIAKQNPTKEIIFFAIGFETTTPPTAATLISCKEKNIQNFSVYCNHVMTPPALAGILELQNDENKLNGIVGPAHVSIVIGSRAYESVSANDHVPIVIAGFEPLDVLHTILMLIRQVNQKKSEVQNQYTRAVTREGNLKSQEMMKEVFETADSFEWRGLGWIPNSALKINSAYENYDAEKKFPNLEIQTEPEHSGCQCGMILTGMKKPNECPLFGKICTPENPIGACMVSSEGACAAFYAYGRNHE